MSRFYSALAVSFSIIALAGVGYVLTNGPSVRDTGGGYLEVDRLRIRLNELEERLDGLNSGPSAGLTPVIRSAAPSDSSEIAEEGIESVEGDGSAVAENPLLTRIETLETRLRGLEEDPVQRAYTYLQSENAELRKRGIYSLETVARSDPEARAALREMLNDPDAGVRVAALDTLADIEDKEVVPLAASLLDDGNTAVRREAINTLTRLRAKDAAEDIASFIVDEDVRVRQAAVDSVGKLGHKGSAQALIHALADENGGVRREAIFSLGEIGATEALPQLRDFYTNVTAEGARDRGDQRYILAYAMKQLGDREAALAEITRLGDTVLNGENDRARGGALRGVIWLGRDEPIGREILKKVADDPNEWIRGEARRALGKDRDE